MANDPNKTIRNLERIRQGVLSLLDDLDVSYASCQQCDRRTFTNRAESLMAKDLKNVVRRCSERIEYMQRVANNRKKTEQKSV